MSGALTELEAFERDTNRHFGINWRAARSLKNADGSQVIYDVSADGKEVRIRSTGQNEQDEGGGGDDIEVRIKVP
jgi:hypothetical protein